MLVLLCGAQFADTLPVSAAWTDRGGDVLPGDSIAFDFERKTLVLRDPLSDRQVIVPTRHLSLRSRQQLLLSPLFHRGDHGDREDPLWSRVKRRLRIPALGIQTLGIPAAAFFLGFWLAGWFFTGRIHPFLALTGFVGSWTVLLIFATSYAFLELRLDGGPKVILLGIIVATGVTPLLLSAVYNCTYLRAQGVLISHLIAGLFLLGAGLLAAERIAGITATEAWWDRNVFEPAGLIGPDPATPRPGS